jgi:D-glycero-D-manno-heptose 1,7-bisphosphate phosphatase
MISKLAAIGGQIDAIAFCPHGPWQGCDCRKPAPGLLLSLAGRFSVPLKGVPLVGDSVRDMAAAASVGATPILVRSGKGGKAAKQLPPDLAGITVVDDLRAAVQFILR